MGIKDNHLKFFILFSVISFVAAIFLFAYLKLSDPSRIFQSSENTLTTSQNDWTLKDLQHTPIRLSDFRGRPVLLVFWATWCPYCKKLLPGIQELHNKYARKGLTIIAVNIREDGDPYAYWEEHNYRFEAVLDGDKVAEIYGIRGTPGIVFIDPKGKVIGVQNFSDPHHPLLTKFAEMYTD